MNKSKEIIGYSCPKCKDFWKHLTDAESCCPREGIKKDKRYECLICGEVYQHQKDADVCCEDDLK